MSALLVWMAVALAGEATAELDGTTVRGLAVVPVAPSVVMEALADPTWENRVQGGDAKITVTKREGACHQVAYVQPHPIMTTSYELRRCRTAAGWEVSLVTSDSFDSYRARWKAAPEGQGSKLVFEVDLTSSVRWVPESLVRSEMKRSVRKLMQAIVVWAEARAAATTTGP